MSLLTALIVKNSHILAVIYFTFLKYVLNQTWKAINTKLVPRWKDRDGSYQIREILGQFSKLVALSLG